MRIKGINTGKLGRISGNNVSGPGASASTDSVRQGGGASRRTPKDDVALSDGARVLRQAGEAAHEAPEIRMEMVQPIKEALAAGKYSVSSLDVADKMLRQVLMERKHSL
uniref:Negative regulator of flagellin synthesis n=1 Tax=Magnetococcus massalia (strain MO-1) TaxID=451514 RepID=A0A1S7LDY8_MAGMO|nr:Anti-sigma-28 factor, FlgM [Candidatus Magnetococcus massalia]